MQTADDTVRTEKQCFDIRKSDVLKKHIGAAISRIVLFSPNAKYISIIEKKTDINPI